jgi:hypothetical protein
MTIEEADMIRLPRGVAASVVVLGLYGCGSPPDPASTTDPGSAGSIETAEQQLIIAGFPQDLLNEHHAWHHGGRRPADGQPGSGLDFLTFHWHYMERARQWYLDHGGQWQDVAPWAAIPEELKRTSLWSSQWSADERRFNTNNPRFHSADELGQYIEHGIHNNFLHNAAAEAYGEPVLATFDSPTSSHFYQIHGLVHHWWVVWTELDANTGAGHF